MTHDDGRARANPRRSAGWRALPPGLAQWRAGQSERGLVLAGAYLSAVLMAGFAWGTPPGLGLLAFALATHLVSTADALRQSRFPTLGARADRAVVIWWLLVGLYAPLLVVLGFTAWPGVVVNLHRESYLVNRWAFRRTEPVPGDLVRYWPSRETEARLGRVVGRPGQAVEWSGGQLLLDGVPLSQTRPTLPGDGLRAVSFRVPAGHYLIRPETTTPAKDRAMVLAAREEILGRAWAQFYPVRERRLLR